MFFLEWAMIFQPVDIFREISFVQKSWSLDNEEPLAH